MAGATNGWKEKMGGLGREEGGGLVVRGRFGAEGIKPEQVNDGVFVARAQNGDDGWLEGEEGEARSKLMVTVLL